MMAKNVIDLEHNMYAIKKQQKSVNQMFRSGLVRILQLKLYVLTTFYLQSVLRIKINRIQAFLESDRISIQDLLCPNPIRLRIRIRIRIQSMIF
jgi:hypothetical protein